MASLDAAWTQPSSDNKAAVQNPENGKHGLTCDSASHLNMVEDAQCSAWLSIFFLFLLRLSTCCT
jgi:hypothetical protein